jgi:hypothetical protein
MALSGVRIADMTVLESGGTLVTFDFTGASGWWRPGGEGKRITLSGQFTNVGAVFNRQSVNGFVSGTLWALHTWMATELPVELYAALGKWTVLHCADHPKTKIAVFPTLVPPSATGEWAEDAGPISAAIAQDRITEGSIARVTLTVPGADGASYVRFWGIDIPRSEDFSGMMTWRFGPPAEAIADALGRLMPIGDRWEFPPEEPSGES